MMVMVLVEVEIDDQRQVIGGPAREAVIDDPRFLHPDRAAMIDLVERSERPESGERAVLRCRISRLLEAMCGETVPAEDVAPVVVIAGDHRR